MSDSSPLFSDSPLRLWRDARITGIFSITSGLIIMLIGVLYYLPALQNQAWPTTEGKVISSEVRPTEVWGRAGPIQYYAADVKYEYAVNGKTLTGSQLAFGTDSGLFSDPARALQEVEQYPIGRTVIVHFNPDNPQDALLNIGGTAGGALMIGFGVFFIVLGIAGLILFRKKPAQT